MPRRRNGHSTPFGSHGTTTPGNGSQSRRAARRRRTGVSTRSGPCCVPTSRSSWWMGRSCSTTKGEEERYLKSLLTNFRQGLLQLREDLLASEGRLVEFPRIWIIALSKADLFPDWDVRAFRDLVIWTLRRRHRLGVGKHRMDSTRVTRSSARHVGCVPLSRRGINDADKQHRRERSRRVTATAVSLSETQA